MTVIRPDTILDVFPAQAAMTRRRRADRPDPDALRPFSGDLTAPRLGQSAVARHVKYTFLFLANFAQDRLASTSGEGTKGLCSIWKIPLGGRLDVFCSMHRVS